MGGESRHLFEALPTHPSNRSKYLRLSQSFENWKLFEESFELGHLHIIEPPPDLPFNRGEPIVGWLLPVLELLFGRQVELLLLS